jgi:hypothetical protein
MSSNRSHGAAKAMLRAGAVLDYRMRQHSELWQTLHTAREAESSGGGRRRRTPASQEATTT